jgi:hypothetical protein
MLDKMSGLCYTITTKRKGDKKMNKQKWYYENARTGEVTDVKEAVNWWVEDGDCVNYWHWSEFSQAWEILMVREP